MQMRFCAFPLRLLLLYFLFFNYTTRFVSTMSSRANANAIVLALNVGAALGAGLLLSGIGLYAYKKLSNRPKKYNG